MDNRTTEKEEKKNFTIVFQIKQGLIWYDVNEKRIDVIGFSNRTASGNIIDFFRRLQADYSTRVTKDVAFCPWRILEC